jgi:RNA polymerase sigma-70 factor (ECF subfamily)
VDALYRQGAEAWPQLALSEDDFAAHVRRVAPERVEGLRAADLFLACACALRRRGAVEAFERTFGPQIDSVLRRSAAFRKTHDDLGQAVRTRLYGCEPAKIALYSGVGPLAYWVRLVAARLAQNALRGSTGRREVAMGDKPLQNLSDPADPERTAMKRELAALARASFEQAFQALDDGDRLILRLYVIDRLTIDDLAHALGLHRATAARRVARARAHLAQATQALMRDRATLGPAGLDSVNRLLDSQLEVSVERILRQVDPVPRAR